MNARKASRTVFALAAALLLSAGAHAQLFRAYVASTGNDANPCTLAAPCRLLPAALAAVASGGEIWMLDSANYNTSTVTIGQSVSILAIPGAVGSVVAIGGTAISIVASGLTVSLRNVAISPFPGTSGNGIIMTGASLLTIDDSVIANQAGLGVEVLGPGTLKMANSAIKNNGSFAVWLLNGAVAEISGTQMLDNGNGVRLDTNSATTTTATISDSIISGGVNGVFAYTTASGGISKATVTRSTIDNSTFTGLNSQTSGVGSATIAISNNMVTNNASAWYIGGTGAVITTLGNNHITDNTGASSGVLTATPLQ